MIGYLKALCFILMLTTMFLGGCGGWRHYVASTAYMGETGIGEDRGVVGQRNELEKVRLPGVEMYISINNTVQTNDFAVMLFIVPISIDVKDKPLFDETDKLTMKLAIAPTESGFVLNPALVKLMVDEKQYSPIAARLDYKESRAKFRPISNAFYQPVLLQHPVENQFALSKEEYYVFSLVFDAPVATVDKDIRLEMGNALMHPGLPRIPLINFREFRWNVPYT